MSSVHWWSMTTLHLAIGDVPPDEFEAAHFARAHRGADYRDPGVRAGPTASEARRRTERSVALALTTRDPAIGLVTGSFLLVRSEQWTSKYVAYGVRADENEMAGDGR